MRSVLNQDSFTPFGLFVRQYCYGSHRLSVTNADYIFEDYRRRKVQIVEEKSNNGRLGDAQRLTFKIVHEMLVAGHDKIVPSYDYWGFYVLKFPRDCDFPGPGMTLNGNSITVEELVSHLNFEHQFCAGFFDPLIVSA